MKYLLAALFCIGLVSHATLAQSENELENHYHEIQDIAEGLHTYMKGTFVNIRYALSDVLYSVNENTLESALVGIRYVDDIIQIVDEYISQSTGAPACVDSVVARWNAEKNSVGSNLSGCSQMAEDRILSVYSALFDAVEAGERISHSVQSFVLYKLAQWNPLDHEYGLDYLVETDLEPLYFEFMTVTIPNLQRLLEDVDAQNTYLPLDVYSCSATAGNDFNPIANEILDEIYEC